VTVKTTAGSVTLARPKLRGASEKFASALFGTGVTKTHALEARAIAGFVRGLSVRCRARAHRRAASRMSCSPGAERPAKIPKNAQADVKADYWAIFDVPESVQPGPDAVAFVQARIDAFARRWQDSYPAAVRCLLADRGSLTVYLRFPREHWTRVRHSNFIERTFGETRRRVKVIGRLPGEHSCLSLVWAVLDRASRGWRGFTMTAAGLRQLQDLRRQLLEPPPSLHATARSGRTPSQDEAPPSPEPRFAVRLVGCSTARPSIYRWVSGTGGRTPAHR
jgi:hypothetical protein